jgi:hypothetical protein
MLLVGHDWHTAPRQFIAHSSTMSGELSCLLLVSAEYFLRTMPGSARFIMKSLLLQNTG